MHRPSAQPSPHKGSPLTSVHLRRGGRRSTARGHPPLPRRLLGHPDLNPNPNARSSPLLRAAPCSPVIPSAFVAAHRRSRGYRPRLASPTCPAAPPSSTTATPTTIVTRDPAPRRDRSNFLPCIRRSSTSTPSPSLHPTPPRAAPRHRCEPHFFLPPLFCSRTRPERLDPPWPSRAPPTSSMPSL